MGLALLVVLSGCAEEEPEPIMPDPPATSTTTSSPTTEPTAEPETAEEFIRRWVAESLRMQTTGDTDTYRKMTKPCEPCRSFADQVEALYSEGGRAEIDTFEAVRIKQQAEGINEYLVVTRASETRIYDSSGAVQDSYTGGQQGLSVYLTQAGRGSWQVRQYLRN